MIRDVVKYLILGTRQDLGRFFAEAQNHGFLEFIPASQKKEEKQLPQTIQELLLAVKILKRQPRQLEDQKLQPASTAGAIAISQKVIHCRSDLEKFAEEKRVLEAEKARIAPFGDFSIEDVHVIESQGKRKIQFFCQKTSHIQQTPLPEEVFYIGTEYDLDYFISISQQPRSFPKMIEMIITASLGEVESRLEFINREIHRLEHLLKEKTVHLTFLQHTLVQELNHYHLEHAKEGASHPLSSSLFFIEAWVPENKVRALEHLVQKMDVHLEPIAIDPTDRVPTCLENRGSSLVGEDLIKIYDIPATKDHDPSSFVFYFFALFFAMIVGDAGYGIILLTISFYLKKKFSHLRGYPKRMIRLLTFLSGACLVWGVLISSYFGLKLAPSNWLTEISPVQMAVVKKADYHLKARDDVYDSWLVKFPTLSSASSGKEMITLASIQKKEVTYYPIMDEFTGNILLEITLIVGMLHLTIAFLRNIRRHIAGIGWILFMIGGYLFFPAMLNATTILEFTGVLSKSVAAPLGLQCLYGGVGFAIVTAIIQHRKKGLGEITNLVQVFADVLSYLRLYALSLAGAIMASTFNQEGSALGLFVGFVVIILGHGINILLSLMGGVIHGLRLNFLEWYHYCFDGGGKLFNPLRKI